MSPIRTHVVASAMADSRVIPSNTSPAGSAKIGAKWSNAHRWSNPASSAMRHTVRRSAIVQFWGESLRPSEGMTRTYRGGRAARLVGVDDRLAGPPEVGRLIQSQRRFYD